MSIRRPFNIYKWVEEHRDELKPPVGNRNLYIDSDDYIVMIVAGPNARKDYHFNETEEWYFQLEGDVNVRIQEDGKAVDIPIKEGEMFLLPARVPHSPQRPEGTIGLVIERYRKEGEVDKLLWFCDNCHEKIHQAGFQLKDIGTQIKAAIEEFKADSSARVCKNCGHKLEL